MSDTSNTANEDREAENDRPPRSKARLIFTIALCLVIILLLVAIFSPVRDVVVNRFLTIAPTPTPTVVVGGDQFYIQADPVGTVTIDGQESSSLTGYAPITLSPGEHKIAWQASPFPPLTCTVFVPATSKDPCNYESLGNDPNAPGERVITFNAAFNNLSSAQQTALKQAIQPTLNTLQSTDTLQPGEQYVYAQQSGGTIMKTATEPLNATLTFHLDTNPHSNYSCTPNGDICSLNGQDCRQICVDSGIPSATGAIIWNIIALYYPTWTYTTQSGQVVARNQPDTSSTVVGVDHSVNLEATWDGKAWHVRLPRYNNVLFPSLNVSPFNTTTFSTFTTPPPACGSLNSFLNSTINYSTGASPLGSTQGSNPTAVNWGFVVGANEAQGCLGVVVPSPNTAATPTDFKQPPAYFLYRFGVLLAANALAHSEFPGVPLADAYEQSIAQQIAAHYNV